MGNVISSALDSIADSLERRGFLREAQTVDLIANTVDVQYQILDIISDAIDQWRKIYRDFYSHSVLGLEAVQRLFLRANSKIRELISDKGQRDKIIEESILASLDPEDFRAGLSQLSQLKYLFGSGTNLYDFHALWKRIKSMRQ